MTDDPLAEFLSLPDDVIKWYERLAFVVCYEHGKPYDFLEHWNSMMVEDQRKLVAFLIKEAFPDTPCPRVTLTKRAAPLRTPSLNRDLECVPVDIAKPSKLFDLTDLIKEEKRSLYPHAAFFCPSGWGKDYNSSKLISQADGEIIACLIKEPEIWQKHCPQARIICNGYDVSEIEQVLVEVSDRNESRMLNLEPKTPLNVVFSDYPSIVQGIKGITEKYISRIIRDGRSNRIRFWFLIQEGNVAALDMEGRSDLLSSITMVRGGKFALEHSKSLVSSGLLTKQDNQFLHGCDRPCIVGNTPALIG
jgi:hypothetical protein